MPFKCEELLSGARVPNLTSAVVTARDKAKKGADREGKGGGGRWLEGSGDVED